MKWVRKYWATAGVFFPFFVVFHGVVCYLPWTLLFILSSRHWGWIGVLYSGNCKHVSLKKKKQLSHNNFGFWTLISSIHYPIVRRCAQENRLNRSQIETFSNLFPVREEYFPDPIIFLTGFDFLGRSTRRTKGYDTRNKQRLRVIMVFVLI